MARILGIDYGKKRTGFAATDPLQLIVSGLETIDTSVVSQFMDDYLNREEVEKIVIGYPFFEEVFNVQFKKELDEFIDRVRKRYVHIDVDLHDESFTSQKAKSVIFASGVGQKRRRDKKLIDRVSAVLILQEYLGHI